MYMTNQHQRILSLEVRQQRLGYAVFAGPNTLLDWGVKNFRGGKNAVHVPLREKIAQLISEWQPDVAIASEPRSERAARKLKTVQAQARTLGVPVTLMTHASVKECFRDQRNKDDRARILVGRFSELSSRLPPRRKPWKSEDYRLSIFDAVALGAAAFQSCDARQRAREG
jgi:hypothetical protein